MINIKKRIKGVDKKKLVIITIVVIAFAMFGTVFALGYSGYVERVRRESSITYGRAEVGIDAIFIGDSSKQEQRLLKDNYTVSLELRNGTIMKVEDFVVNKLNDNLFRVVYKSFRHDIKFRSITKVIKEYSIIEDSNKVAVPKQIKKRETVESKPMENDKIVTIESTKIEQASEEEHLYEQPIDDRPYRTMSTLEIISMPKTTEYLQGSIFNPDGLVLKLTYLNGSYKEIKTFEKFSDKLMPTDKDITILLKGSYNSVSCKIPIRVNPRTPIKFEILKEPIKLDYIESTKFNSNGMSCRVTFDNGDELLDKYQFDNKYLNYGQKDILIYYEENNILVSVKQNLTVKKKTPVELSISCGPDKLVYIEDTSFNDDGLVMSVLFDNDRYEVVNDYEFTKEDLKLGETFVTLSYTENYKTVKVNQPIKVNKKKLISISVKNIPNKTDYIEKNKFQSLGMVVTGFYDNEKSYIIDNYDYDKEPLLFGVSEVVISYTDDDITKTTKQPISVRKRKPTSLLVKNLPNKLKYIEHTIFDDTGLSTVIEFDNGEIEKDSLLKYTKDYFEFGTNSVEISYEENNTIVKNSIPIIVCKKSPVSLKITKEPKVCEYIEDTSFKQDGIVITSVYDNGQEFIVDDYKILDYSIKLNTTDIKIRYKENNVEVETSQKIKVNKKNPVKLKIVQEPSKLTYVEGTVFSDTGLKLKCICDNGVEYDVSKDMYTYNHNELQSGENELVISYTENDKTISISQTISVTKQKPISAVIKQKPKFDYIEGETFDGNGLVVLITYDNFKTKELFNQNCKEESKIIVLGQQQVNFEYTENNSTILYSLPINTSKKKLVDLSLLTQEPIKTIEGLIPKVDKYFVSAKFDNGLTEDIICTLKENRVASLGEKTLNLLYTFDGITKYIDAPLEVKKKEIISINLINQTEQNELCKINTDGWLFNLVYDNNEVVNIDAEDAEYDREFICVNSGIVNGPIFKFNQYTNMTYQSILNVKVKIPVNLKIIKKPDKLVYTEGERFKPDGMVVKCQYSSGLVETITNYTFNSDKLREGMTSIKISYTLNGTTITTDIAFSDTVGCQMAIYEKFTTSLSICLDCGAAGTVSTIQTCPSCSGVGRINSVSTCSSCNGSGGSSCWCGGAGHPYYQCSCGVYRGQGNYCNMCHTSASLSGYWSCSGRINCSSCSGNGYFSSTSTCSGCSGSGKVGSVIQCPKCNGVGNFGYVKESRIGEVRLPKAGYPENGRHTDGFWYSFSRLIQDNQINRLLGNLLNINVLPVEQHLLKEDSIELIDIFPVVNTTNKIVTEPIFEIKEENCIYQFDFCNEELYSDLNFDNKTGIILLSNKIDFTTLNNNTTFYIKKDKYYKIVIKNKIDAENNYECFSMNVVNM